VISQELGDEMLLLTVWEHSKPIHFDNSVVDASACEVLFAVQGFLPLDAKSKARALPNRALVIRVISV
jgi:hypothetical protein